MPRVLIIDDEEDILTLVAVMLRGDGYDVLEAVSGQVGLELMTSQGADLVILDVMMPDMSGWEVCRRIKTDPATSQVPVIMFTVRDMMQDMDKMRQAQPDGFINKPFEQKDLLKQVATLLAPV